MFKRFNISKTKKQRFKNGSFIINICFYNIFASLYILGNLIVHMFLQNLFKKYISKLGCNFFTLLNIKKFESIFTEILGRRKHSLLKVVILSFLRVLKEYLISLHLFITHKYVSYPLSKMKLILFLNLMYLFQIDEIKFIFVESGKNTFQKVKDN